MDATARFSLRQDRDADAAIDNFKEALASDPDNIPVNEIISLLLIERGRSADEYLMKLWDSKSDFARYHRRLAECLQKTGASEFQKHLSEAKRLESLNIVNR